MDTNQNRTDTTIPVPPSTPPPMTPYRQPAGLFGSRMPASIAFVLAILLFLLPFSEIKCGGTTIANITGLNIGLKKEWKSIGSNGLLDKSKSGVGKDVKDVVDSGRDLLTDKSTDNAVTQEKGNSWIFALAALGIGILGLLISLLGSAKTGGAGGMVTGVLGAGALIGLMIMLKNEVNASLAKQAMDKTGQGANGLGFDKISDSLNNYTPTLSFTPWFYFTIIVFLAAAAFSYMRISAAKR